MAVPASPPRSRFFTIIWILLLVVGAFFLFAAVSDLLADARVGLPSDHLGAFQAIAGISWSAAQQASPGTTQYVTLLEYAYAVHELVFGIFFLIILAIPFRRHERWAWWACWAVMLANITYSLTFGRHDNTILLRSLVADIAVPVLLLLLIPAFFGAASRRTETQ